MYLLPTVTAVFLAVRCVISQTDPSPTTQPPDFPGEDTPYRITPTGTDIPPGATGNVSAQNKIGTWLYGYTGCSKFPGAKAKIDGAYYDAWVMSNTKGVAKGIDWNNAAALEFLGAPGLNSDKQSQIQAVLANAATVIYSYTNPLTHWIKVRCDDPLNRCQNRPDQDPCQPNPPNPGDKPKPTPLAYARNSDTVATSYPMINVCPGFLNRRSLADAITYGKGQNSPGNLQLSNYDNRAQTFLHELLHLDLAADSPSPNPRVTDLTISIKIGHSGNQYTTVAYGPLGTKLLARWQGGSGLGSTGYWVQRNSDNLAYYALAKYVTGKLGNIYPHLPLVTNELDGPPYPARPATIANFVSDGTNFYLNTTDSVSTFETDWALDVGDDYPGCSDDENSDAASEAGSAISINGFAPASAYPDAYNSQVSSWVAALETATAPATVSPTSVTPTKSATSAPPAYVTGTCSFHLTETQDCSDDSSNLFAVVNLKDGAGNDIGDTKVDPATDPIGIGINSGASYSFDSKLPKPIIITGEHENDYVQFVYGDLSWQSKTPNGGGRCNNGGWNPRDGPICGLRYGDQNAVNNMDCFFPC
ncbi:hypothetical protein BDR22DRAFT_505206 [Usnea florida]